MVARIADRVSVMYAGQVVESAPVQQLYGQPTHPYTQGLLGCIPVRGKTEPGSRLQAIPGVVPSLIGAVEGCAFYNRCPQARQACLSTPALLPHAGQAAHAVRCVQAHGGDQLRAAA